MQESGLALSHTAVMTLDSGQVNIYLYYIGTRVNMCPLVLSTTLCLFWVYNFLMVKCFDSTGLC